MSNARGRLPTLVRYRLPDPVSDTAVGKFSDPQFASLYNDLVTQGSASLAQAYQVGCLIEELDIADLHAARSVTAHADIQFVYGNLERGSRNHLRLRAFSSTLKATGGSYQAKHLTQRVFDQIAQLAQSAECTFATRSFLCPAIQLQWMARFTVRKTFDHG